MSGVWVIFRTPWDHCQVVRFRLLAEVLSIDLEMKYAFHCSVHRIYPGLFATRAFIWGGCLFHGCFHIFLICCFVSNPNKVLLLVLEHLYFPSWHFRLLRTFRDVVVEFSRRDTGMFQLCEGFCTSCSLDLCNFDWVCIGELLEGWCFDPVCQITTLKNFNIADW